MKAVVIGCGRMGAQPSSRMEGTVPPGWLPVSHVEALIESGKFSKLALCETNPDSLTRWGSHYGIDALFSDYREMAKIFQPDVATLATRTPVKREILEFLAGTGVSGIYLEKPISNSVEDAEAIVKLLGERGIKLAYGVNRRYHAAYRQAKALIEEGVIGEVLELNIEHGPSQLLWTHPHSVDLIQIFAGPTGVSDFTVQATLESDSVNRISDTKIDSDPVIEFAHFRFSNGITANIGRGIGLNIRVHGREGVLIIHGNGTYIEVLTKQRADAPYFLDRRVVVPEPKESATVTALKELAVGIDSSCDPGICSDEIVSGMRMLMGCVWSHLQGGRRIASSEVPPSLHVSGRTKELYA